MVRTSKLAGKAVAVAAAAEPDPKATRQRQKERKKRVPPSFQSFAALFCCMMALVERLGLLREVALASAGIFVVVMCMTLNHAGNVRTGVLGDRTPMFREASLWHGFSTLSSVSMLRLSGGARDDATIIEAIAQLSATARKMGGQVCYVGRAVQVVVQSSQLTDADDFDVVVLASWAEGGQPGFEAFRRVLDSGGDGGSPRWERHIANGFWRNAFLNMMASGVAMLLLRLKCGLRAIFHDVHTPAEERVRESAVERLKNTAELADAVDKLKAPDAGVMIFNCLNSDFGSAEDQASDRAYGQLMMEMLSQHGGGPVHVGSAVSLSGAGGEHNDGNWKQIACVYYPGCAFFARLMRSEWMAEAVGGKKPGDSIAVLTIPFAPADPLADPEPEVAEGETTEGTEGLRRRRRPAETTEPTEKVESSAATTAEWPPAGVPEKAEPLVPTVPTLVFFQMVLGLWLLREVS